MNKNYIAPEFGVDAFNCPICNAYSAQKWMHSTYIMSDNRTQHIEGFSFSQCQRCKKYSIWLEDQSSLKPDPIWVISGAGIPRENKNPPLVATDGKIIYPLNSAAPMPSDDMPQGIKSDYLEAREIFNASPRGSAALLRLCLQRLMPVLGAKGKNINDDIQFLVEQGLPVKIRQALDSLRVIGNEAVHPGSIDLNDDRDTALALFNLMNFIVDQMITQPKEIDKIYNKLPDSKRKAIDERDNKNNK